MLRGARPRRCSSSPGQWPTVPCDEETKEKEETEKKEETNNAEEEEPEAKDDSNATSSSHEKTPEEIANAVSNVFFVSPGHFINL